MIVQVVFVALLVCAAAENDRKIGECNEWACFATAKCVGETTTILPAINQREIVKADCDGIVMIRPYSKNRWLVAIEAWDASVTEVKVQQGTTELFSCKTSGAESSLPGFKYAGKYTSDRQLSCKFFVGDGLNEVITRQTQLIKLVSNAPSSAESAMKDSDFDHQVQGKVTCDPSNVLFEDASSDEVAEPAQVSLEIISCINYKLQYKSGSSYVDASGGINCKGTTSQPVSDYKYVITTAEGDKEETGQFNARCAAKVCSLCKAPSTPAGKSPPTVGDAADGCKTLTCPKFFKIGDEVTSEKAVCGKINDKPKWAFGGKAVEAAECVDEMPCKPITSGCDDDCKLDTGLPSCADNKILSITIDAKSVQVNITCDTSRGQLTYKGKDEASVDLNSGTVFSCKAPAEAELKIATGGIPTSLQACLGIAFVLTFALIGCSFALWVWKRNKDKKKAAEENNDKKTGE